MQEFWGLTEINKNDPLNNDLLKEDCFGGKTQIDEIHQKEIRKESLKKFDLNSNENLVNMNNLGKTEGDSNENHLSRGFLKNENELKSDLDLNESYCSLNKTDKSISGNLSSKNNVQSTDSERKTMICSNFARVYFQLDSFSLPMLWKLGPSKIARIIYDLKTKKKDKNEEEIKGENERLKEKKRDKKSSLSYQDFDIIFNDGLRRNTASGYIEEEDDEKEEVKICKKLIDRDPLNRNFNEEEKHLLFKYRNHYKKNPAALPIFLSSIEWTDPNQVEEMHKMLKTWAPLSPQEVIKNKLILFFL